MCTTAVFACKVRGSSGAAHGALQKPYRCREPAFGLVERYEQRIVVIAFSPKCRITPFGERRESRPTRLDCVDEGCELGGGAGVIARCRHYCLEGQISASRHSPHLGFLA